MYDGQRLGRVGSAAAGEVGQISMTDGVQRRRGGW